MSIKKNRVYGLLGLSSVLSNWNADFDHAPRHLSDKTIFGSDRAMKYAVRNYWSGVGEDLLVFKKYQVVKGKNKGEKLVQPKSLDESYSEFYSLDEKDKGVVLGNVLRFLDVSNFGSTFAVKGANLSVHGVAQIGQGFNKLPRTKILDMQIGSPFRNSNKDSGESSATTLGSTKVVDEAFYVYPFSVNPNHLDEYVGVITGHEGYTDEHFEKFKVGALRGATHLNTHIKYGTNNAFGLFVELVEGSETYLPPLERYVTVAKIDGKVVIDLSHVFKMLNRISEDVASVEIYLDDFVVEVKTDIDSVIEVAYKSIIDFKEL